MITVVSPHIDDAAFSLGGIIAEYLKNDFHVDIMNVFTQGENSAARIEEEGILQKSFPGMNFRYLGIPEAPQRGYDFSSKMPMGIDLSLDEGTVDVVVNALQSNINIHSEKIYFPLGIGCHPDHLLLWNVGRVYFSNTEFYEDMPYASNFYENPLTGKKNDLSAYSNELKKMGLFPTLHKIDIKNKETFFRYYKLQPEKWWPKIMAYAYDARDNCFIERTWG